MQIHISRFLHTTRGKNIISVILGFGLASLFRTVCKNKNCIMFSSPPLEDVSKKIYRGENNKCYKFVPHATKCSSDKKIISFYNDEEE
jgi:hypothetical protein